MKSFDEKSSTGAMLKAGHRTIGMCLGHPKARPHVGKFTLLQEALEKAQLAANAAENAYIRAYSECELRGAEIDEDVEDMQFALEAIIRKNYADPLYRAFFPKGLTEFKDLKPEELQKALPGFIQLLNDSGHDDLARRIPLFQRHLSALGHPLDLAAEAGRKNATASLALAQAKVAWLDGYASLEGSLLSEFPRRKRFVARFFPSSPKPISRPIEPVPPGPVAGGTEPIPVVETTPSSPAPAPVEAVKAEA